ncbi:MULTISPECIES: CsbD family protein [Shewanella]|uniref:CsbD family protein n=2 Tax=Shewanella TaxID=22 RepID=A0A380B4M0_9GAMM|nr:MULTISPECIES: CsbD family protein [Shewanella]MCL1086318.1 CsbD family protein [Shewanella glacialipiscicola]PTA51556.1 CsbD family protein [Shewanella morhuae]SUI92096.1 CsbD-like [Shewanella morhuae]GIU02854.1 CsbD family protein [Shewanella morhuae]GIU11274.1 CsbD family protein [Shewanella glacialipiscicola]
MNNDIVQGKWKQVSGTLKANWGKLTDDDLLEIDGNLEKFQGKMQEKYGMAKDEAKKEFEKSHL